MRRSLSRYRLNVTGDVTEDGTLDDFGDVYWVDGPPGPLAMQYTDPDTHINQTAGGRFCNMGFWGSGSSAPYWQTVGGTPSQGFGAFYGAGSAEQMPNRGWIKKLGFKMYPSTPDDVTWNPTEMQIRIFSKHPVQRTEFLHPSTGNMTGTGATDHLQRVQHANETISEIVGLWRVDVEAYDLRSTTANTHNLPDPYYGFYDLITSEDPLVDYHNVVLQDDVFYHKGSDAELKIYLKTDTAVATTVEVHLWVEEATIR